MGDLTWSVKMSEDLKEKIAGKLQESGLTGKEFMESLLGAYELQNVKEIRPEIAPDLQELESLSKRLCSIYVNIGERITSLLTDKENYYKEILKEKDELIKSQEEKIKELEAIRKELEKKAIQLEKERDLISKEKKKLEVSFQNELKQLTEITQSNKALIDSYKQKNYSLTEQLVDLETYKRQNQVLKAELEQERDNRKDAQVSNREAQEELKRTRDSLLQVEEQFKDQIKSLREQCNYEKDRALLEQEKALRNEIQLLREEYNVKVKGLLDELEARQGGQVSKEND